MELAETQSIASPPRRGRQASRGGLAWALLFAGLVSWGAQAAQRPIKGFKIADYHTGVSGGTNRLRSLLAGAEAVLDRDGVAAIRQGLTLMTFQADGRTNAVVRASECLYDPRTRTASSTGALDMVNGDGRLSLSGEGFLWRQTNASLAVSNRVRTLIREAQPIEVQAGRFEYWDSLSQVTYEGDVRAQDPQVEVECGRLIVQLPESGQAPTRITAETNVVARNRQDGSVVTAQRAEYRFEEGREWIDLTGSPVWRRGQNEGRADRVRFDRRNRILIATGKAQMRMPRDDLAQPGFLLPRLGPSAAASVPPAAGPAPGSPASFLTVEAEEIESHTNRAAFRGDVRIRDESAQASPVVAQCGLLTVATDAAGQLRELTLEQSVALSQDDRGVSAGRVHYTAADGRAVWTGQPSWRQGMNAGSADRLEMNRQSREIEAIGHARLVLPISTNLGALLTFPGATNSSDRGAAAARRLELESERYRFASNQVVFAGPVTARERGGKALQGTLHCQQLTVHLDAARRQIERVTADGGVLVEPGESAEGAPKASFRRLSCERMALEAPGGVLARLEAEGNVMFHVQTSNGELAGRGRRAIYLAASDEIELEGDAALEMASFALRAPVLVFDRTHGTVRSRGGWKGSAEGRSILPVIPDARSSKRPPPIVDLP